MFLVIVFIKVVIVNNSLYKLRELDYKMLERGLKGEK